MSDTKKTQKPVKQLIYRLFNIGDIVFVRPNGCFSNHFMDDLKTLAALNIS
jgi:hypothetical protein